MRSITVRLWAARMLIGLVFFFNVQCALAFLTAPGSFAPGFEMAGDAGAAAVRGLGILFLMWNVPYAAALCRPVRWRLSLYEAIIMQATGFIGELLLLRSIPAGHAAIHATLARFILFDGAGLAALLAAALLTRRLSNL